MKNPALAALRRAIAFVLSATVLGLAPLGCGSEPGKTMPTEPTKAIEKSNQGMLDHTKAQAKK